VTVSELGKALQMYYSGLRRGVRYSVHHSWNLFLLDCIEKPGTAEDLEKLWDEFNRAMFCWKPSEHRGRPLRRTDLPYSVVWALETLENNSANDVALNQVNIELE
jgi:hypothetical protein